MRLVIEMTPEHLTGAAAIRSVAAKLGIGSAETVRKWVRRAQIGAGTRPGNTSEELAEVKKLKRENAELRCANEILKAGSAYVGDRCQVPVLSRRWMSPSKIFCRLRLEHMDRLRFASIGLTVLAVSIILSACAGGPPPKSDQASAGTPTDVSSTNHLDASPAPTEVLAYEPDNEPLVGTFSNQRGILSLGPFTPTTDRIAVYVDCVGGGQITLTIDGVGEFPNACGDDAVPVGTRNTFDVQHVDSYTVTINGEDDQLWAVSISAVT